MRDISSLKKVLENLGFANFEDLAKTVEEIHPSVGKFEGITNPIYFDDLYSDASEIGYVFVAGMKDNLLQLHSVRASYQLNGDTLEQTRIIEISYQAHNGEIPHKDQLRLELLQKIEAERMRASERQTTVIGRRR